MRPKTRSPTTRARSAALWPPNYGNPAVRALTEATYDHLATCAGGRGVLTPRGMLMVGNAPQAAMVEEAAQNRHVRAVTVEEAVALVPILQPRAIARAAYAEAAKDIDTDLLIQDFTRQARENGAVFHRSAPATDIVRDEQGWQVTTPAGTFEALTLVNAAGAWADGVARMAGLPPLGLTPYRRSMARVPAPGGHDVSRWPFLLNIAEDWCAKPDAGKWLISRAEEDPSHPHDSWPDDMVLAEGLARYEDYATEPVTRVETSWAGLRTFVADRALVLGRDPLEPSFVWCAGQGGFGFQTSAAASALVAALVAGTTPEIDAESVRALNVARLR